MPTIKIADKLWQKIYSFLRAHLHVYTGGQEGYRRFVKGIHWILRTGAQWRALPERYGNWNSVYKRFSR